MMCPFLPWTGERRIRLPAEEKEAACILHKEMKALHDLCNHILQVRAGLLLPASWAFGVKKIF